MTQKEVLKEYNLKLWEHVKTDDSTISMILMNRISELISLSNKVRLYIPGYTIRGIQFNNEDRYDVIIRECGVEKTVKCKGVGYTVSGTPIYVLVYTYKNKTESTPIILLPKQVLTKLLNTLLKYF